MNINQLITEGIKKSRIYNVSNPKVIKEILSIPQEINIKKIDKIIDNCYDEYYIQKSWAKEKNSHEDKIKGFLSTDKEQVKKYKKIPHNMKKEQFRKIVAIKEFWLKKSQKKFNKILSSILLTKKIWDIKQESVIPYLHSSVKQRSFNTNAKTHIGNKYVLAIDLKDFYPSITKEKVYYYFKNNFNLPSDIAMFYAVLSTCKSDDGTYRLGQGLSQSATLAYLINSSLFNYLYDKCLKNNIEMTVYVDDVVFSSNEPIKQKFIDELFGLIKRNGMKIKKEKIHYYNYNSTKKITGIYITGKKTRVSNEKHWEINEQYLYLKDRITKIKNFDDYFEIYNVYLKFYGNYQYIKNVEIFVNDKYTNFINCYDIYFPKGVNKKQSSEKYSRRNIKNIQDIRKFNESFQKLKYLNTKK